MNEITHISYRINSRDEIVFINDEWSQFALTNNAQSISQENVLFRSLWDFISDDKVKYIYKEILRRVNAGRSFKFNLRCDSPEIRRLLEMNITPQKNGEAQFDTRTIWTQLRMPPILFKNDAPPTDNLLIICSWCNKIETGNGIWEEIEEAVRSLRLFELETLPKVSHGMCESCYQTVSLELEKSKTA